MLKRVTILASILLLALFLSSVAVAQDPVPQHSDPNWQASYWNNMTLSGTAVLQRSEANLDYDWGAGSPAPGIVNNDQFSARWTRYVDFTAGTYRFTATADDGIRVWLDNELIINDWSDPARLHPRLQPAGRGCDLFAGRAGCGLKWGGNGRAPLRAWSDRANWCVPGL
jgi:hypothetical protein